MFYILKQRASVWQWEKLKRVCVFVCVPLWARISFWKTFSLQFRHLSWNEYEYIEWIICFFLWFPNETHREAENIIILFIYRTYRSRVTQSWFSVDIRYFQNLVHEMCSFSNRIIRLVVSFHSKIFSISYRFYVRFSLSGGPSRR